MKIVQLTIDVDSALLGRMEEAADYQEMHLNDMVLGCVEKHVERQELACGMQRHGTAGAAARAYKKKKGRVIAFPQRRG